MQGRLETWLRQAGAARAHQPFRGYRAHASGPGAVLLFALMAALALVLGLAALVLIVPLALLGGAALLVARATTRLVRAIRGGGDSTAIGGRKNVRVVDRSHSV